MVLHAGNGWLGTPQWMVGNFKFLTNSSYAVTPLRIWYYIIKYTPFLVIKRQKYFKIKTMNFNIKNHYVFSAYFGVFYVLRAYFMVLL